MTCVCGNSFDGDNLCMLSACQWEETQEERVARFLFDRQADSYEADPAMRELAWIDPDIRSFWIAEAGAVLEFINGT
jgi:hypothetical protein